MGAIIKPIFIYSFGLCGRQGEAPTRRGHVRDELQDAKIFTQGVWSYLALLRVRHLRLSYKSGYCVPPTGMI